VRATVCSTFASLRSGQDCGGLQASLTLAVSVQVTYTNNYVNPPTDSFPGVVNLVSGATCRAARPSAPAPAPPPGRPGPRLPPLRAIERARSTVSHAHMCEACKHGVTRQLVLTCTRAPAGGSSKVSGIFYGARASFMCLSWFACFSLHNSRQCMVKVAVRLADLHAALSSSACRSPLCRGP